MNFSSGTKFDNKNTNLSYIDSGVDSVGSE